MAVLGGGAAVVAGAVVVAGVLAVVGDVGPVVVGVFGALGAGVPFFLLSGAGKGAGEPGSDGNGMKPPGGASAGRR